MKLRALLLALAVILPGSAVAQSPPEGHWRLNRADMTIQKQGDIYLVHITCPGCMGPIAGDFVGPLKGAAE
jgi:hypothetical protein